MGGKQRDGDRAGSASNNDDHGGGGVSVNLIGRTRSHRLGEGDQGMLAKFRATDTDVRTDRQTDGQTDGQPASQPASQPATDGLTHTDRQTDGQTDRQTARQTDGRTNRQTVCKSTEDRRAGTQTPAHMTPLAHSKKLRQRLVREPSAARCRRQCRLLGVAADHACTRTSRSISSAG
jgi:hypothetical protein